MRAYLHTNQCVSSEQSDNTLSCLLFESNPVVTLQFYTPKTPTWFRFRALQRTSSQFCQNCCSCSHTVPSPSRNFSSLTSGTQWVLINEDLSDISPFLGLNMMQNYSRWTLVLLLLRQVLLSRHSCSTLSTDPWSAPHTVELPGISITMQGTERLKEKQYEEGLKWEKLRFRSTFYEVPGGLFF